MKKFFMMLLVSTCLTTASHAQVKVEEPEFAEETLLLTSNTEGVKLSRKWNGKDQGRRKPLSYRYRKSKITPYPARYEINQPSKRFNRDASYR